MLKLLVVCQILPVALGCQGGLEPVQQVLGRRRIVLEQAVAADGENFGGFHVEQIFIYDAVVRTVTGTGLSGGAKLHH